MTVFSGDRQELYGKKDNGFLVDFCGGGVLSGTRGGEI